MLISKIMFNIKRQKHLYTAALGHSHIQLYKTEKEDSLGKSRLIYIYHVGVVVTLMPNTQIAELQNSPL